MGWRVNTDLLALSVYTLRSGEPEELVAGAGFLNYGGIGVKEVGRWVGGVLGAEVEGDGIEV